MKGEVTIEMTVMTQGRDIGQRMTLPKHLADQYVKRGVAKFVDVMDPKTPANKKYPASKAKRKAG